MEETRRRVGGRQKYILRKQIRNVHTLKRRNRRDTVPSRRSHEKGSDSLSTWKRLNSDGNGYVEIADTFAQNRSNHALINMDRQLMRKVRRLGRLRATI